MSKIKKGTVIGVKDGVAKTSGNPYRFIYFTSEPGSVSGLTGICGYSAFISGDDDLLTIPANDIIGSTVDYFSYYADGSERCQIVDLGGGNVA